MKTLTDLHAADYNPRHISPEAFAGLGYSMHEFGDLSGIVFNQRTGRLVGGHQRVANLRAKFGDLPIQQIKLKGTPKGESRAIIVDPEGNVWPIRVVSWDDKKEKAANVTANNPNIGGQFTTDVSELISEIGDWNIDFTIGTGLDSLAQQFTIPDFSPDGGDANPGRLDVGSDDQPWNDRVECPKCHHQFNPQDPEAGLHKAKDGV